MSAVPDRPAPAGPLAGSRLPRGKARAHSRLVRVLRIVLPMVMVGVIGVLIGFVSEHAVKRDAAAQRNAETPIRMINPHFFGRDNAGRAFTLGAHQASRDERDFQTVILDHPNVTLDVDGPRPSHLSADVGIYHEDSRLLLLRGDVKGNDAKIAKFATDAAVVNTRTGMVTGEGPLAGKTPMGEVKSRRFDVYDKGDKVIFKGGVHARLNGR
ncbi:MAG: LPS export ABC transporter periplasmic protein LptC [Caulobacteraceae bacterium]